MFKNRTEAGRLLAARLQNYSNTNGVVLAVPRGGVPIGYTLAKELHLPLEIVLSKKIGHPANREYAIGAAGLTDVFVVPHAGVSQAYIDNEVLGIQKRLIEMQHKFNVTAPVEVKDKIVIVADDGIATGNTLLATVNMLRKASPSKIVVAAPVASGEAIRKLREVADEIVVLLIPLEFYGVGAFYEEFEQVSDEQVLTYLNKMRREINHTKTATQTTV